MNGPKIFEEMVTLIKEVVWPLFAFTLFLYLRGPLKRIVEELPKKLASAKEIKAGSFSLTIQETAQAIGRPEFALTLKSLSREARELYLQTGRTSQGVATKGGLPPAVKYHIRWNGPLYRELLHSGLIKFEQDLDKYERYIIEIGLKQSATYPGGATYEPSRPLTESEEKLLLNQRFTYTEMGKEVFALVVEVVAKL